MKRKATWAVFVGGVIVVLGVLWQAFSMAAYVRGAGEGALDAHAWGAGFVHIGQLAIIIGALIAYWGNWRQVGYAVAFLVVSVAQLAFLGDPDKQGDWINGLHGLLAMVLLIAGVLYAQQALRELKGTASRDVVGNA